MDNIKKKRVPNILQTPLNETTRKMFEEVVEKDPLARRASEISREALYEYCERKKEK